MIKLGGGWDEALAPLFLSVQQASLCSEICPGLSCKSAALPTTEQFSPSLSQRTRLGDMYSRARSSRSARPSRRSCSRK